MCYYQPETPVLYGGFLFKRRRNMAHKKSLFILITAFILMALVSTGCERSYAPIDESLPTPTGEGNAFPDELPADMEGVFEAGAQTATAQAVEAGAAPAAAEATAVPVVTEGDTELAPAEDATAGEDTPTEAATTEETPATATSTAPVLDPTATTAVATDIPSVDINNLPANYTFNLSRAAILISEAVSEGHISKR